MKKTILGLSLLLASGLSAQTFFSDDFEGGNTNNWTMVDSDGDGQNWFVFDATQSEPAQVNVATSASWSNGTVLYPDNWLISTPIDLTSASGAITFNWKAWGQDPAYAAENYSVYVGTSNEVADLLAGTPVYEGTATGAVTTHTAQLDSYAGQTVYVAFRHHNVSDMFRLNLDDVKVFTPLDDDLSVKGLSVDGSMLGNRTFTIEFENEGINTVTDFDFNYTYDGTNHSENVSGVSLATGDIHSFTFNETIAAEGTKTVSVEITTTDMDMGNNSDSETFSFFPNVIQYVSTDIHGNDFNLYDRLTQGQAIILDFMASWCGPCESSTPALSQLVENNGSGYGNVEALAISVEQTDNNSVLSGLNWNGGFYEYPKFAYTAANNNNYYHYAINHGFNTGGGIPFFVMICPNVEDPANSDIAKYDVGYGQGMFGGYQTALDQCPSATYLDVIEMTEDFTFSTYPNPATSTVNVEFNLATENNVSISVVNTVGQTVVSQELGNVSGLQTTQLDVSTLQGGMYIVKVRTGNVEKTQMISVL